MIHCTKCSAAGCYLSLAVHFVTGVGIIQGGISWPRIRAPLITSYPDECYFRGEKKKNLFSAVSFLTTPSNRTVRPGCSVRTKKKRSIGAFICLCVCALSNMTQYEVDCRFPSGYKSLRGGFFSLSVQLLQPRSFHPSLLSSYHLPSCHLPHSEVSFVQILARIFCWLAQKY